MNAQIYDEISEKIRVVCLFCRETFDRHFAINIKQWLQEALTEFDVKLPQLLGVSVDRAANITKAADLLIAQTNAAIAEELAKVSDAKIDECIIEDLIHECLIDKILTNEVPDDEEVNEFLPKETREFVVPEIDLINVDELFSDFAVRVSCVVHQLQLAVVQFMTDQEVAEILEAAKTLSKKLRGSVVMMLMRQEGVNYALLDQITRWNSTMLMLVRLLTLKDFCVKHEKEKDYKKIQLPEEMWKSFKSLSNVLAPAGVATKQLQDEQLTVADAVCYWLILIGKLRMIVNSTTDDEKTKGLAKKLLAPIEIRWKSICDNKLILAGWFLDKKMGHAQTPEQNVAAKDFILMVAHKLILLEPIDDAEQVNDIHIEFGADSESSEELNVNRDSEILDTLMNDLGTQREQEGIARRPAEKIGRIEKLKKEIDAYENLPRITTARPECLKWWSGVKEKFPLLSRIAVIILSVPVTEVTVERMFSHLKVVLSDRRTKMNGDLLEAIIFLRLNKKFSDRKD